MEPQEEHNEAEKGKRNMEKLFDLQVFAQENTQTTGGLSAEMKTYYGMELLDNAKPQLVHNQFAATKPLPTGGGKTVPISACVFLQRVSGNLKCNKNGRAFDADFEHPA